MPVRLRELLLRGNTEGRDKTRAGKGNGGFMECSEDASVSLVAMFGRPPNGLKSREREMERKAGGARGVEERRQRQREKRSRGRRVWRIQCSLGQLLSLYRAFFLTKLNI